MSQGVYMSYTQHQRDFATLNHSSKPSKRRSTTRICLHIVHMFKSSANERRFLTALADCLTISAASEFDSSTEPSSMKSSSSSASSSLKRDLQLRLARAEDTAPLQPRVLVPAKKL